MALSYVSLEGPRGGGLEPPSSSTASAPAKICHVLGLGNTIHAYTPDGNFSIGCNDSFKYHPSNYLVCVSRLSPERNKTVMESKPEKLLSFIPPYNHHPAYEYMGEMHPWRSDRPCRLDKGMIWTSNNTPFIACVIAYNMGYKQIVLWGVDFTDHPNIKDQALEKTIQDFVGLSKAMSKTGVAIYLGSEGSVLPFPKFSSTFATS